MSEQARQPPDSPQPATSHFDAAKAIVEALKGLDKPSQALAFRFAGETLGLQPSGAPQPSAPLVSGGSSALPQPSGHAISRSMDIKQFTASKAPKSDQQFAAVVAYFYQFEAPEAQRTTTIDAELLTEAARLAGRRRPPRPNITLHNAKAAGYLDASGAGRFRLNSVGENLVAMALPESAPDNSYRRQTNKKKVPQNKTRTNKSNKPGKSGK